MLAPNFTAALLTWYDANRRDLPWRHSGDGPHPSPYAVLVSEFMLQQTTVNAVIPRFRQWLEEYPGIRDLADAGEEEVLRSWEGLGYYSRARNLHASAREIVQRYGGKVPDEPGELKKLPGIGEYTAAAVASIAYGVSVSALDANSLRVWSRLLATPDRKRIAAVFARIIPGDRPGDFNQALMDLGSLVCTPSGPGCPDCPLASWCRAYRWNRVPEFPPNKKGPGTERIEAAIGIILNDGKVLVQKRPEGGLFSGMWEFPGGKLKARQKAEGRRQEVDGTGRKNFHSEPPEDAVVREIREETGLRVQVCGKLGVFNHVYTRFRVKLHVFICKRKAGKLANTKAKWVTLEELEGLPMPSANRQIIKRFEEHRNPEDAEYAK